VDDPGSVRGLEPGCNLAENPLDLVDFERAPLDPLLQRRALVVPHGDEGLALPGADLVHDGDIGVVELARRAAPSRKRARVTSLRVTEEDRNLSATGRRRVWSVAR